MSPPPTIRKARRRDLPRVLEIERASFGVWAYESKLFAEYLLAPASIFLAAWRSGRLLGYALCSARGPRSEVVSLAVDPSERGSGVASALLASSLRRLRLRGASRVFLMVRRANRPARGLYAKFGFRQTRLTPGYYEDGAAAWRMSRNL